MKICFLIPSVTSGGIEMYLLRFLRYLKNTSEITVLVRNSEKGELYEEYLELGVSLKFLPLGYVNPCRMWKHYHYYKQQKFDVICDFNANFAGIPMFLANLLKIPKRITFYRQGSNHFNAGIIRNSVNGIMNRLVHKNATQILSNSQAAIDFFFPYRNLSDPRFKVVYNGVNALDYKLVENKNSIRKQLNIPLDAFVIGHVGRYDKAKNHKTILKVFQRLLKRNLNGYLVLCGKDTEKLSPEINELGIKKTTLVLGYRKDIPRVLKSLDCFLFPSITEGQPNALIEAMNSGIPIIASDIPAIRECVAQQMEEFLCNPLDIEGFVDKVCRLAESDKNYKIPVEHLKKFDSRLNFGLFNRIVHEK